MLSIVIASRVGVTLLVINLSLVWERILVIRVVWGVAGSPGVSKICLSEVLRWFGQGRGEVEC